MLHAVIATVKKTTLLHLLEPFIFFASATVRKACICCWGNSRLLSLWICNQLPPSPITPHTLRQHSFKWLRFSYVITQIKTIFFTDMYRARVVVKALCYMSESRGFEIRWGKWYLSIYLILPAAIGPRVYSASNINEYQKQKNNVSGK
jgi:hypothetical protein